MPMLSAAPVRSVDDRDENAFHVAVAPASRNWGRSLSVVIELLPPFQWRSTWSMPSRALPTLIVRLFSRSRLSTAVRAFSKSSVLSGMADVSDEEEKRRWRRRAAAREAAARSMAKEAKDPH